MAALSNVTTSDTFLQWVTKTNQIISQYNETNTLATNAYEYSNNALNNVVIIAANTTANILFSNAYIIGLIVNTTSNTVISNGANIILSNTTLMHTIKSTTNVTAGQAVNSAWYQANTGYFVANQAFYKANTANMTGDYAYSVANQSFSKANTGNTIGTYAYAVTNQSFAMANTGYFVANQAFSKANNALANTGDTLFSGNLTISRSMTIGANLTVSGGYLNVATEIKENNIRVATYPKAIAMAIIFGS